MPRKLKKPPFRSDSVEALVARFLTDPEAVSQKLRLEAELTRLRREADYRVVLDIPTPTPRRKRKK